MNYFIFNSRSSLELEATIKKYIADGWELQGGVSVAWHESAGQHHYFQAMIKKETSDG